MEEAPLRERGRLARILWVGWPLSFPVKQRPVTLPPGTPWARLKRSPGAVAGRAGWRRGVSLRQCCAGGTPALPEGPSSRYVVAAKEVHRYWCLFVFIRGSPFLTIACFSTAPDGHGRRRLISQPGVDQLGDEFGKGPDVLPDAG